MQGRLYFTSSSTLQDLPEDWQAGQDCFGEEHRPYVYIYLGNEEINDRAADTEEANRPAGGRRIFCYQADRD